VGETGKCWVHNVVFTCGAVAREDNKEILDAEDEILVYYGAADTVISVATARIANLIPFECSHHQIIEGDRRDISRQVGIDQTRA